MKKISMTLSSPTVALTDGKGALTVSVTNSAPTPERVVLGAFSDSPPAAGGAAAPTWTTVTEPQRTVEPGATVQYDVKFDTTGAEPGSYPIKFIPYSADQAPEEYAELAAVIQLVVPPKAPAAPPKRFPWLLVAGAAVVIVLLAAGSIWFFTSRDSTPEAAVSPSTAPSAPALQLTSVVPAAGPQAGGTAVKLLGRFREPTVVVLGGVNISGTLVSNTEFSFVTPPQIPAGKVLLEVRSDGVLIGASIFEYTQPGGSTVQPTFICAKVKDCFLIQKNVRDLEPGIPLPPKEIPGLRENLQVGNR
ncbi:IPT/TIG domain-containing protein [Arthrobacter sp. H35-D1]|uniref:IPT/TIG domain-containing protein n=1 Tax=Arthrobacter sp. H35-D1 TaxID=3046202 RepID=UPI0024BACCAA|nr:IPT/TIG domain-containing protein [Arthrobacter sp. H35-D1]MDJ0313099.1 hypothetical protein [Arthrobacter sp. H35-D1]